MVNIIEVDADLLYKSFKVSLLIGALCGFGMKSAIDYTLSDGFFSYDTFFVIVCFISALCLLSYLKTIDFIKVKKRKRRCKQ